MQKILSLIAALCILLVMSAIVYSLVSESGPAIRSFGFFDFISSSEWNHQTEQYGAFPFLVGTISTALLALFISIPFSLSWALLNGFYFKGRNVEPWLDSVITFAANVPAIIWGVWGYHVFRPLIASVTGGQGLGILTASIVLAVMITPFASSLIKRLIDRVPTSLIESAYSLGATDLEVVGKVLLPYTGRRVAAIYLLSLGKVMGESMIAAILLGNVNGMPHGLTDSANSFSSILVNQFGATGGLEQSALLYMALMLFLLTAAIHFLTVFLIRRNRL